MPRFCNSTLRKITGHFSSSGKRATVTPVMTSSAHSVSAVQRVLAHMQPTVFCLSDEPTPKTSTEPVPYQSLTESALDHYLFSPGSKSIVCDRTKQRIATVLSITSFALFDIENCSTQIAEAAHAAASGHSGSPYRLPGSKRNKQSVFNTALGFFRSCLAYAHWINLVWESV